MEFQVLSNLLPATKIKFYVCWQITNHVYQIKLFEEASQINITKFSRSCILNIELLFKLIPEV